MGLDNTSTSNIGMRFSLNTFKLPHMLVVICSCKQHLSRAADRSIKERLDKGFAGFIDFEPFLKRDQQSKVPFPVSKQVEKSERRWRSEKAMSLKRRSNFNEPLSDDKRSQPISLECSDLHRIDPSKAKQLSLVLPTLVTPMIIAFSAGVKRIKNFFLVQFEDTSPTALAQVKHQAAQPFEDEGQGESGERTKEPATQNPNDLFPLDRFASAREPGAGHRANESLIHGRKEALGDGDQHHERLNALRGACHGQIHFDHVERDRFQNASDRK